MKRILFLMVLLTLWACHRKNSLVSTQIPPMPAASSLQIQQLEAIDLSENQHALSTFNDEILLLCFLLDKNPDASFHVVKVLMPPVLTFDTIRAIHPLSDIFSPSPDRLTSSQVCFILVELDNTDSEQNLRDTFEAIVTQVDFFDKYSSSQLDTLLGFDDFLGWQVLPFRGLYQGEERELIFKGSHFFDKYDYRLQVKGQ